ncbi:hypothetical protein Tco_0594432, partial [Tanacetum coccineum]
VWKSVGYGVSISWIRGVSKELDTAYLRSWIRRIQGVGYGVLGFLGLGTTFDIF